MSFFAIGNGTGPAGQTGCAPACFRTAALPPFNRHSVTGLLCGLAFGVAFVPPAQAQVAREMQNGGFEANNPGGGGGATFAILPNGSVPGWDSTSGSIELWDTGFNGVPSFAGSVHAELNANTAGALFQNICLINGETLRWRFAHRNRSGGPSPQNVSLQVASSTGTLIQSLQNSAVTSTTAWALRSNTAGVAYTGSTGVQRVQFITTDPGSYGNFLDDISFTLGAMVEFESATTSAAESAASPTLPALLVTGTLASDVSVTVTVSGGTATLGTDYTTPTGTNTFTVTIPAGTYNSARIPLGVTINPDNLVDSGETIQFSITPTPSTYTIASTTSCATTSKTTSTHTILDDAILASNDSVSNINGAAGAIGVVNALSNDMLEGNAVNAADVTATVVTPATPIGGGSVPVLNVATGAVDVPAGTPSGSYTIRYQICQILQPANCSAANVVVTVAPAVEISVRKTNTPGLNGEVDQATDTVTFGTSVSYTIIVSNSGPDAVTGVVVQDVVGTRLNCPATNPVSISGSGVPAGSFTIANLTGAGITLGTLNSGQSATLTFSCQVN